MFLNEPRTSSPGSGVKRLSIRRHVGAFGSITVNWNIVSYFITEVLVILWSCTCKFTQASINISQPASLHIHVQYLIGIKCIMLFFQQKVSPKANSDITPTSGMLKFRDGEANKSLEFYVQNDIVSITMIYFIILYILQ